MKNLAYGVLHIVLKADVIKHRGEKYDQVSGAFNSHETSSQNINKSINSHSHHYSSKGSNRYYSIRKILRFRLVLDIVCYSQYFCSQALRAAAMTM
jgi:predicted SprT family Zn-dependent metalloprotease